MHLYYYLAAEPASQADLFNADSAKVFPHVASQHKHFPLLKGNIVIPSGLLPSPRLRPTGSKTEGLPDVFSALKIMSLNA